MTDTDTSFKADAAMFKSRSKGGLSRVRRVCRRCRKRKSQSVMQRSDDGRYLICKACTDQADVYKGVAGELTFKQYIKLRGLSEKHVEVIQRAAAAYRSYVKWCAKKDHSKDRYQGVRADNVLTRYAGTDYALAAKLSAATVLLAKERAA